MAEYIYIGPSDDPLSTLDSYWPVIAVDTETISLKNQVCIGIGIMFGPHRLYVQTYPELTEIATKVMWLISRPDITKVYHNVFYDYRVLCDLAEEEGLNIPDLTNIADTSLMAKVSGHSASLEDSSIELLNFSNEYSIKGLLAEAGHRATMLDVPIEMVAAKCLNDVYATYNLRDKFNLTPAMEDCYNVDLEMVRVLLKMELQGLALHQPLLLEHQERLKRKMLRLGDVCAVEGFNPGSSQQVGYVLATRGNILPFTKGRKQLRTDEEVLEELDDPLAQVVLDYRSAQKLLGTYVEPWVGKERATTHFRMDLSTGRLASFDRNLQNIPPEMRAIFKPDNVVFSWFDYSQIELRTLAHMTGDKVMLEAYENNYDLHQMTADVAGVSRADGKTFNFAKVFGASNRMLARKTSVPAAQIPVLREAWDKLYPDAARWISNQMYNHGATVESLYGRKMQLPLAKDGVSNTRAFEIHVGNCAVNYPIQGTAADIMKRAIIQISKDGPDMRLQIHDELLIDGYYQFDKGLESVCPEFKTPFEAKFGPVWKKD